MRFAAGAGLTLLVMAIASPTLASDGVREINQTCAVQTGCFAGDAALYPVTIDGTAGYSYRLTSDLVVPDASTDGIVISTGDVGIDLNGFAIVRSGCEGATTDCTPASGSGSGVQQTTPAIGQPRGVSVKNGSISGMGGIGVIVGAQAEVSNLRVRWNRSDGVNVGIASKVVGNIAHGNGGAGITANIGSTVTGNTAYQNGGRGIAAFSGSTISGNTTYGNVADGIFGSTGSTVSGNTARQNGASGIVVFGDANVHGNTVQLNGAYGLDLTSTDAYRDNVISSTVMPPDGGTVDSGVDAGGNVCNGTLTCP